MEKLASQMLDKLKGWVNDNPELVKATLLSSGVGALAGAALTSKESEHERASTRAKRRLKNALFGALAAGGSIGLLGAGLGQINTAKLTDAPTPQDKLNDSMKAVGQSVGDAFLHPLTLTGAGGYGAVKGLKKSWDITNRHAAALVKSLESEGVSLIGTAPKLGKDVTDDALRILRDGANVQNIEDFIGKLTPSLTNQNPKFNKAEVIKSLRRAGLDITGDGKIVNLKNILPNLGYKALGLARRNWRTALGAALATGATAGTGAIIKNLSED